MMDSSFKSRGLLGAVALGISLALLLPAQAQFWGWGSRPQRQQDFNPYGGWFGGNQRWDRWEGRGRERERDRDRDRDRGDRDRADRAREAPADYSHAPGPSQKKPEAKTTIVVMGDANADWLAYGLEDAFSEKPEIAIVRKHRTDSGLIHYGGRGDIEWPQVAREIIMAEKPKFIIMMIGNNDRQFIREKAPPVNRPATPKANGQHTASSATTPTPPVDTEQQSSEHSHGTPADVTPEQARQASYGPWEFHSEKWELAYIKRIDATIAALKSAGVPVMWVGLPSQRGTKASSDSSYLNEIYRSRAEKAGIVYIDIWDGFVDEAGLFSPQGPDYEGQIRRLRTSDGVYFTKFGARKIAHYVEREIDRNLAARSVPVALPVPGPQPQPAPNAKQGSGAGGNSQRPMAGPVVPLATSSVSTEELLGGSRAQPTATTDAMAIRVLTKGESVSAPSGRADDFNWPRGADSADPTAAERVVAKPSKHVPAARPRPSAQQAGAKAAVTEQKLQVTAPPSHQQ